MCNKYYELEYINEGYSPIQKVRNSCSSDNCSSGCGGGCHYDCGGGCSPSCGGDCKAFCAYECIGCSDSCSGCGGTCSGSCSGCSGCSGCGGCDGGCNGTCKNGCQETCTGAGAKISINGVSKMAKFYTGISNTVKSSSIQYFAINGVIKTIK